MQASVTPSFTHTINNRLSAKSRPPHPSHPGPRSAAAISSPSVRANPSTATHLSMPPAIPRKLAPPSYIQRATGKSTKTMYRQTPTRTGRPVRNQVGIKAILSLPSQSRPETHPTRPPASQPADTASVNPILCDATRNAHGKKLERNSCLVCRKLRPRVLFSLLRPNTSWRSGSPG